MVANGLSHESPAGPSAHKFSAAATVTAQPEAGMARARPE